MVREVIEGRRVAFAVAKLDRRSWILVQPPGMAGCIERQPPGAQPFGYIVTNSGKPRAIDTP